MTDDDARQAPLFEDGGPTGAKFGGEDEQYRYRLHRTWDPDAGTVAFVMLNPSTADATKLDPTCRRCKGYAEDWGYGTLVVGNLFAVRATNPDDMKAHDDPVGPENDAYLREICDDADLVVAAWGAHGSHRDRAREVPRMLDVQLHALETTKAGHPGHPLYLDGDLEPEPWDERALLDGDSSD